MKLKKGERLKLAKNLYIPKKVAQPLSAALLLSGGFVFFGLHTEKHTEGCYFFAFFFFLAFLLILWNFSDRYTRRRVGSM